MIDTFPCLHDSPPASLGTYVLNASTQFNQIATMFEGFTRLFTSQKEVITGPAEEQPQLQAQGNTVVA